MYRMAGCGKVDSSSNVSASSKLTEPVSDRTSTEPSSSTSTPECAICLQSCIHPVRLPCCHVFCFLCVKGASWLSKRCALCRHEIPEDFLERPVLLSPEELKAAATGMSRSVGSGHGPSVDFAWYYEGRNGWWQYDERTNNELEEAFSKGKKSTEMLIAGFLYVADFESMVQYRRNEQGRRRKIKRDAVDIPKKGVAGLRLDPDPAPISALPVVTPSTVERISSADGSDTENQSQSLAFGILAPIPPIRPSTLLGNHHNSSLSPSTLEESFSQLQLSHSVGERFDGEDEQQMPECASNSSESEEQRDCTSTRSYSMPHRRQRQQRESQPARVPPGSGLSSSALSVRSRSPDGQCTVTEV